MAGGSFAGGFSEGFRSMMQIGQQQAQADQREAMMELARRRLTLDEFQKGQDLATKAYEKLGKELEGLDMETLAQLVDKPAFQASIRQSEESQKYYKTNLSYETLLLTAAAKARANSGAVKGKEAGAQKVAEANETGVPVAGLDVKEYVENGLKFAVGVDKGNGKPLWKIALGDAADPHLEIVNSRAENGDQVTSLYDKNKAKVVQEIGRGPTVQYQPATKPGGNEIEALRKQETSLRNFVGSAEDVKKQITAGGEAGLGAAGATARGLSDFAATLRGFASQLGVDTSKFDTGESESEIGKKADAIWKRIQGSAAINDDVKSLVTDLAYQAAAANGQRGQGVSNRDFENNLKQIGGAIDDPKRFSNVIDSVMARVQRNFHNSYRVLQRDIPELKGREPPDVIGEEKARRAKMGGKPPPGARIAVNPSTGQRVWTSDGITFQPVTE